MTKPFICTAIAALALALPAQAEMPRYDVEKHCDQIAGFGASYSSEMFNFCIDSEQAAYNALRANWDSLSPRIQRHCDQIAAFAGPGSYEMLKFCTEEENSAEANRKTFTFD